MGGFLGKSLILGTITFYFDLPMYKIASCLDYSSRNNDLTDSLCKCNRKYHLPQESTQTGSEAESEGLRR